MYALKHSQIHIHIRIQYGKDAHKREQKWEEKWSAIAHIYTHTHTALHSSAIELSAHTCEWLYRRFCFYAKKRISMSELTDSIIFQWEMQPSIDLYTCIHTFERMQPFMRLAKSICKCVCNTSNCHLVCGTKHKHQ